MATWANNAASFIWKRLGSCTACIRKAWLATAIALTFSVTFLLTGWHELLIPSVFLLLGLSVLWAAHLVAFASKVVVGTHQRSAGITDPSVFQADALSRRAALPLFLRTLFWGALISVAPRSALADQIVLQGCGTMGCNSCAKSAFISGQFRGCFGCHSCGNGCSDGAGSAFPNGC